MNRNTSHFFPVALVLFAATASAQLTTDATFVFTDDVHVSFNGASDSEGIIWEGGPRTQNFLIMNETAGSTANPFSYRDGCVGSGFNVTKDLCNQIQQIRKLNALPKNQWLSSNFTQHGHSRTLASSGQIAEPLGVLIGGDLTDCGGGSNDSGCDNGGYNGTNLAQYLEFLNLYDKEWPFRPTALSSLSFLKGLSNPDSDVPLKYSIYPGLGNHDLGFSNSPTMQSYIDEWSPDSPLHPVTNSSKYHTYSFDFGRIHIVNVGVFPGSDNGSHYEFNQDSMNWLSKDLAAYASDGRPVIIYAHFGFDSFSMNGSWWGDSNRIDGYTKLWGVIQNYNVIGYFAGHNHSQAPPASFIKGVGTLPIDTFQPGAAYHQDFAVVHVTDKNMDVMFTNDSDDFKNSNPNKTVNFSTRFTKQLVPAPQPSCFSPDVAGDSPVIGFTSGGKTYELGAGLLGTYHLRTIANCRVSLVSSGLFGSFPATPSVLTSYTLGGTVHVLVLGGAGLYDYTVSGAGVLTPTWKQLGVVGDAGMVFADNGANYLLLDEGMFNQAEIYRIGSSGATLEGLLQDRPAFAARSFVPFTYTQTGQQLPGFLRLTDMGIAEVHYLTPYGSTFQDQLVNTDYWTLGSHASVVQGIPGQTQIMVATDPCSIAGAASNCATTNTDAPYSIHTLLPDQSGTDISWHGWPPGLALNAQAIFQLGMDGKNAVFGA